MRTTLAQTDPRWLARSLRQLRSRTVSRHHLWGYVFLAPMMLLLVAFKLVPMVEAFRLSLTSYDLLTPPRFIGFANYATLAADSRFLQSVFVTLYYTFGTCIPIWVLSLGLALVFNRALPARNYLRLAYFLPAIVPVVVFATIWRFIFHPYGLLNVGIEQFGLPGVNWLTNSAAVIPGFILAGEWRFVPYFMVVYLAGLQNIPRELNEAAEVDGANARQRFWYITLPLLRPTILLVVVVSVIMMSKAFTSVLIISGGGPDGASTVLGLYIYKLAFQYFQMGLASAASMLLLAAIMLLTILQLWAFRDRHAE
ncbi:MAG: sugar ABC transporter permease [Chloroflexi bacterium]|nr:sugar ABC transporter permease [Chloroflexota bacterium]